MTKTEYEKELEREIKQSKGTKMLSKKEIELRKSKLEGYKKGKEEGIKEGMERGLHLQRVRMIELGDKKFINDLYTDDTIDTDSYDIIVNTWERIKRELNQGNEK